MSWRIELGNGRVLSGLTLSVDTFLSDQILVKADFAGGLKGVKIESDNEDEAKSNPEVVGEHEIMELTVLQRIGKKTGFTLRDVKKLDPESVKKLRADVDYLLMLSEEA